LRRAGEQTEEEALGKGKKAEPELGSKPIPAGGSTQEPEWGTKPAKPASTSTADPNFPEPMPPPSTDPH